jgi:type II restriction/modification system DNA methylase subunit YeeA
MNTNHLKKFAQAARKLLMEDVSKRLLYWGIGGDGEVVDELTRTIGGYIFRGDVYNDQSIPDKWNALVSAIKQHSLEDIIEEAAYTWFNRIIAIKILEKNGYDPEVLAYVSEELSDPVLLQNAKKGILPSTDSAIVADLKEAVLKSNDEVLFSKLLIHHCKSHHLLNNIFGHINDYTELLIPQTLLSKGGLLELINLEGSISSEDYGEVELIGWLYQFYISDKKDEVFAGFKKKKKARTEDIPAATQIFTPKWIVKYLVENTVGRIWLDLHPESPIRETMKYLVEPENPIQDDPIIQDVTELKVLDPAVGSGHFLVVAFDLLIEMYQEEGYTKRKAIQSIISNNLYGLDICPRAVGLANFAILLKAASHNVDILTSDMHPNIYAMPEPFDFQRRQIEEFLGEDSDAYVDEVHTAVKLLKKGQNIGSALKFDISEVAKERLDYALSRDKPEANDLNNQMINNRLRPYAHIASILSQDYPAVVANPPYMSSKNMNADLSDYLKTNYPRSKPDLFAVFMEASTARNSRAGLMGMINQQSWMFLSSYLLLRTFTLNNYTLKSMIHLGPRLFDELSGEVVQSTAFIQCRKSDEGNAGDYYRLVDYKSSESKHQNYLKRSNHHKISQADFSKIPGSPIAYWVSETFLHIFDGNSTLGNETIARQGLATGDNSIFARLWHEISIKKFYTDATSCEDTLIRPEKWYPYNKGGEFRRWYGNIEWVVNWESNGKAIRNFRDSKGKLRSRPQNTNCYFNDGITWSDVTSGHLSVRALPRGAIYDISGHSAFPIAGRQRNSILVYLNTKFAKHTAKILNPTLHFQIGDYQSLPFPKKFMHENVSKNANECIEICRRDWDSFEISWDFNMSPLIAISEGSQSLLSQKYQGLRDQWSSSTLELKRLEEENNQIFIDCYNLKNELSPNVQIDEITLKCNPHYRYKGDKSNEELEIKIVAETVQEMISYCVGCYMGRYRLDKPGLNIAHPNPTEDELAIYLCNGQKFEIDDDAIIPIMGSNSPFSDDIVQRVQQFVLMVWGEESYTENLNFINEAIGEDLEKFLTKKFWDFHKKMYKKRPIYWQFASPKGAFKVLTYMHRMNRFTVQVIRKNYLFKQMNWLEREIASLVENEATLQTKESKRLDKLRKDLIECREYDLLLKDMADRQIEFDLDDGVVENYKLFEGVVSKI